MVDHEDTCMIGYGIATRTWQSGWLVRLTAAIRDRRTKLDCLLDRFSQKELSCFHVYSSNI
eukprot:scaffold60189_cov33-Tisochrysis_lutea.AAC.2